MIDLTFLHCPICHGDLVQEIETELICGGCFHSYPIIDGIPAIKVNIEADTALELDQYELDHPVDPNVRANIFKPYAAALQKYGIDGGVCLEIGSGTGNLTAGLVQQSGFSEVHCSDISAKFLNRLRTLLSDDKKLRYWLFDASALPFKSQSMDSIFGHSVLHHLLDYEGALKDIFRVLRSGGVAMFGEPIMDSHALTSFCAAIILRMEAQSHFGDFSEHDLNALRAIRNWAAINGKRMREHRQELANIEDKHVYIIEDMRKLAQEIGFRDFDYNNSATVDKIGNDHYWAVMNRLKRLGVAPNKLAPYKFVFDDLSDTYGAAMGSAAPFNFGFFTLKK